MDGAEREDDVMCTTDNYLSPYLLRSHGSYVEVMQDVAARAVEAAGGSVVAWLRRTESTMKATHRISKLDPRRAREAQHWLCLRLR